jgi:hypothetical protein
METVQDETEDGDESEDSETMAQELSRELDRLKMLSDQKLGILYMRSKYRGSSAYPQGEFDCLKGINFGSNFQFLDTAK